MKRLNLAALAFLCAVLLPGGCATSKRYKDELPHNLEVNSKTESVEPTLDIYSVNEQCETAYLGTVALDRNFLEVGIVIGQPSYLVVGFSNSSFWASSSGYISYNFTLLPRKAYRYAIDVSYIDDIYHVAVHEINRNTGEKREMESKDLQNCR